MRHIIDSRALLAFFLRELHAAMLNRMIVIFSVVCFAAGLGAILADVVGNSTGTAGYLLLQAGLYLVPLLSILIGTSSAQSETEEHAFLMSQPAGRGARVLGKFLALWIVVALAVLLLIVPAIFFGAETKVLGFLLLYSLGLGGIFAGLGLALGFSTRDRVKAHMMALSLWLLFLAGGDLLALALAQTSFVQGMPDAWLLLLMMNPLDAFRISALLSLDRIPFDLAEAPAVGRWWLTHLGLWFSVLCTLWISLSLLWGWRRVEKLEL